MQIDTETSQEDVEDELTESDLEFEEDTTHKSEGTPEDLIKSGFEKLSVESSPRDHYNFEKELVTKN